MQQPKKEDEWTSVVTSRRQKQNKSYDLIKAIKHYWNGFDTEGQERWYIELSNGIILANNNKDYEWWVKKILSQ